MTPQGNIGFTLEHIYQLQGKSIDVAPGSGHIVCVSLPDSIPDHYLLNIEYAMLIAESF